MNVRSAMYNRFVSSGEATMNYLMAGPILPQVVYFLFTLICFVLVVIWVIVLLENRPHVAWIHYYMLATLMLKALNLYCEAMRKRYIDRSGSAAMWWDVWFYTSGLLKAVSFHTVLLVIGYTQWQILRPRFRLRARDKGILMVLIGLQLGANAARMLSDKAGLYGLGDTWWLPVFAFVNCFSLWLLVLSLWSALRNLLTVRTHKRATIVLRRYELFRHYFNVVVVVYILFGPILEYLLLAFAASHEYCWIISVALELVTLAFYAYTGYLFAPNKEDDPHHHHHHHHHQSLLIEDEEAAARRLDEEEDAYARLFTLV